MKILKYFAIQILACLIFTGFTIGQVTLNVAKPEKRRCLRMVDGSLGSSASSHRGYR